MLTLLAHSLFSSPDLPRPLLAFALDGSITAPGRVSWREGTKVVRVAGGVGIELDGRLSGWMVDDSPALALSNRFTISAWIQPYTYVDRGPGAQILFRGDDRNGLDPYSLCLQTDGKVHFGIQDSSQAGVQVMAPVPLHQWTHVVASFDGPSQVLRLFINGKITSVERTAVRPMISLDPNSAPGIGVGNIQWDRGVHNQPFHGIIADLRLYNSVVTPEGVGFDPRGWNVGIE